MDGVIVAGLNAAFAELGSPVRAAAINGFDAGAEQWAFVEEGQSSSEIQLDATLSLVTATLSRKGVLLGTFRAPATGGWNHLARVLNLWCVNEVAVTKLANDFPEVEAVASAEIYEQGPAAYADYMWDWITQRLEVHRPEMLPIVKLARARPELGALFPYLSHFTLCFSHFTGFPYSSGYPRIMYAGPGNYAVSGWRGRPLGEGSPEQVIEIAIRNLPQNTHPAIHGTEGLDGGA